MLSNKLANLPFRYPVFTVHFKAFEKHLSVYYNLLFQYTFDLIKNCITKSELPHLYILERVLMPVKMPKERAAKREG